MIILQGKTKPQYTPHALGGDWVVVINSQYIRVSGDKI
ncbi:MAG TPA: 50S ribosomal protein L13, partial [Archaeoglobaceae archaeon]|nr:50S ribosomal protein L13 [Archaeoglobaceae archaeon]